MTKKVLILTMGLVLGFSTTVMAQSKNANAKQLAVCDGSVFEDGGMSEIYRIYLTDDNQVFIKGQYRSTRSITVDLNKRKAKVIVNDHQIKIRAEKKMMGILKFNDLEIDIDFKSGRGLVSHYVAIESLLKSKKIYLENCQH